MADNFEKLLGRIKHIHFVGIGGAGMSGIAEVLHNLGYTVSGSDRHESRVTRNLQDLGIHVMADHAEENVGDCDVVVYSSAVANSNPELVAARRQRIPAIPRAEMLAELMRFKHGIAVAGTHGKTTTTSLIASLLGEGGLDPTYVIGGLLNSSGTHARLGKGKYLVAEADESDASFLHLQPVITVLTNVDADHLENYGGDFARLKKSFADFLQNIPFYGLAVICIDNRNNRELLNQISKPVMTYGVEQNADIQGRVIKYEQNKSWFHVSRKHCSDWLEIELNLPGLHNIQNALAAITVAHELGVKEECIINTLRRFEGIGRRFQVYGQLHVDGKHVVMIDDYAHHPSEISATIRAVRQGWPGHRLVVIFQPHRYSRTRDLFEDFTRVLSEVEVLILLDIYAAGETPVAGADSRSLCRAIRLRGQVEPIFIENKAEVNNVVSSVINENDILLVLGAGDVASVATGLAQSFSAELN